MPSTNGKEKSPDASEGMLRAYGAMLQSIDEPLSLEVLRF
jgi:hypothetical protein